VVIKVGVAAETELKERKLRIEDALNSTRAVVEEGIEAGIVDPTKVTRSALQNAGSVAAMFLTTEAVIADKPEEGGGMGGMM